MKSFTPVILISLYFLGLINVFGQSDEKLLTSKVVLSKESKLIIHGKTNVNNFSCQYTEIQSLDTIEFIMSNNGEKAIFNHALLNLYVKKFDCGNNLMNQDFQSLLQASKHPMIIIEFLKYNRYKIPDGEVDIMDASRVGYFDMAMEVAGFMKNTKVEVYNEKVNDQDVFFLCEMNLDIRDFGLEAPEKFMGLIKVNDEISVELQLSFTLLP
jgi:hypothetical protein